MNRIEYQQRAERKRREAAKPANCGETDVFAEGVSGETGERSLDLAISPPFSPPFSPQIDRSQEHRPTDRAELAKVARQLVGQGVTPWDVATILHLSHAAIMDLLGEST